MCDCLIDFIYYWTDLQKSYCNLIYFVWCSRISGWDPVQYEQIHSSLCYKVFNMISWVGYVYIYRLFIVVMEIMLYFSDTCILLYFGFQSISLCDIVSFLCIQTSNVFFLGFVFIQFSVNFEERSNGNIKNKCLRLSFPFSSLKTGEFCIFDNRKK